MNHIKRYDDRYHSLVKKFTNQTGFGLEDLLEKAVIFYEAFSSLPTDHFVRFCDAAGLDELHQILLQIMGERFSQLRSAIGSRAGAFAHLELLIKSDQEYFDIMLMVAPIMAEADATTLLDEFAETVNIKALTRPQFAN